MKKRILLSVCILAVLAAAIVCLPFARKIDTTVTATEYRFDDPSYAVEHTVVIQGYDTRNLLGCGEFTGRVDLPCLLFRQEVPRHRIQSASQRGNLHPGSLSSAG